MKEVFLMKKWIACILVIALSLSLFGCLAKMTAVESFLLAMKKMDLVAMRAELVPDEKMGSLYTKLQETDLDEETLNVLIRFYSLAQYTVGEASSVGVGEQKVTVTLKVPDVERILSLVKAQTLVSGDSAASILEDMLEDGSISKSMMKDYSLSVKMTETDGAWKIPYGDKENADFVKALSLTEMLDFIN